MKRGYHLLCGCLLLWCSICAFGADRLLVGGTFDSNGTRYITVRAGTKLVNGQLSANPSTKTVTVAAGEKRFSCPQSTNSSTAAPLRQFCDAFGYVIQPVGRRYFNCLELAPTVVDADYFYVNDALDQRITQLRSYNGKKLYDAKNQIYTIKRIEVRWPSQTELLDVTTPDQTHLIDAARAVMVDGFEFAPLLRVTLQHSSGKLFQQDIDNPKAFQDYWRLQPRSR